MKKPGDSGAPAKSCRKPGEYGGQGKPGTVTYFFDD
jgi:hypothetical protein